MNKKISKILSVILLMIFLLPLNNVLAAPAYDQTAGTYTDDFTDNSGVPTRSYVNVNTTPDVLQLTNTSNQSLFTTPYRSTGYVLTSEIIPTNLAKWETITFDGVTSASTTLKIQICDSGGYVFSDDDVPGNSTGFSSSPIDISSVPITTIADLVNSSGKIGRLKLKITMTTTDTNYTPTLDNLIISWTKTQGDTSTQTIASSLWPVKNIDQKGTAHSEYENSSVYSTFKWVQTFATSSIDQYNLMYNNDLIFLDWNNKYTLYSLDTGGINWSKPFAAYGSPAISQNGTFYQYDISNDIVVALDLSDSSVKWTYNLSSGHGSSAVAIGNDGSIYFPWGAADNSTITIYALNPDGTLKWTSPFNPTVYSDIANPINIGVDGTIYFIAKVMNGNAYTGLGRLYALNATTGAEIWHYDGGDIHDASNKNKSVVIDNDGVIYFGNYSTTAGAKNIYAINSDGTLKWVKDYSDDSDYGYVDYILRSDGVLLCARLTSSYTVVLEAINTNNGSLLWTRNFDGGSIKMFTDKNNGLYLGINGTSGSDSVTYFKYYDSDNNLKWQTVYTYAGTEGSNMITQYLNRDKVLDERGWIYGAFSRVYYDEFWSEVPENEYIKYFAMAPWTMSVNRDSVYYYPGDTINFTITSSMLSTNVVFGGDNKAQVVIDNGDKIPLTYQSLNSAGNSIWTGSYTIPSDFTTGVHTYTAEVSQPYIQTDITTNFTSAPTASNNTGLTASNSFNYITSFGGGALACSLVVPPEEGFNITINNGATETSSRNVVLNLVGRSDIVNMAISNNPNFINISLEPFVKIKNWVLTPGNDQKNVYVKFYNSCGESSPVIPVSINLRELDSSSISVPISTPITSTSTNLQSILNSLLQQLADLQQQLANQQEGSVQYQFTRGLQYRDTGEDVTQLQIFLKNQGTDIYPEGLVTGYFGSLTKLAVQRFQVKYNIAKSGDAGYGYVGPKTRAKINSF
jgi:outer membrane protein assembly factor BamB